MKIKNIFRIELWLFVLICLMVFSTVGQGEELAPDSEYLQKIALGKDILEKNLLQETNIFVPQDEKVVTWFKFSYDSTEKICPEVGMDYPSRDIVSSRRIGDGSRQLY